MFNQINDSPQSGIAPHDFYAKILYGKSPEKYGFVLGVTMGRVLVLIQVRRAPPAADKHTSRHKQPNKTFQTNPQIKERKIGRSAEPPADPLGRSPRFSVPILFRLLLNACLLSGKRFLFPSFLFGFSSLVFLPTWLFYFLKPDTRVSEYQCPFIFSE